MQRTEKEAFRTLEISSWFWHSDTMFFYNWTISNHIDIFISAILLHHVEKVIIIYFFFLYTLVTDFFFLSFCTFRHI